MTLNDLALWATLGAFIAPLIALAFSARRWLVIRGYELKAERFQTYHRLVHNISVGASEFGPMKLTSQLAYVHELRNFPEYAQLTQTVLGLLRKDWGAREDGDKKLELLRGIDATLAFLQRPA
ncbi:MAG: hypothetical protein V4706_10010 [Pseudomonadota bacterium]